VSDEPSIEADALSTGSHDSWLRLFDNLRDAALLMTADGYIVSANTAAEQTYGRDCMAFTRLHFSELSGRSGDPHLERLDLAQSSGVLFEATHLRANGDSFPVEISSRGLTLDGERLILWIIRDITERHRKEADRSVLFDELSTANAHLEALLRIVSSAYGAPDPRNMFSDVLEALREVMGADAALFFVREVEGGWRLSQRSGYEERGDLAFSVAAGEGFVSMVERARRPLWVGDVGVTDGAIPVHEQLGVRAMLGVPLVRDSEVYGVLECTWSTERLVSDAEIVMLQVAADRIMSAMASAELFETVVRQRELESGLALALEDLSTSHEIDETIPAALRTAAARLGCDVAAFGRLHETTYEVLYGVGIQPRSFELASDYHPQGASGDEVPVVRIGPTSRSAEWIRESFGVCEAAVVPVAVHGEWFGALLFGRTTASGEFDELTDDFARRISSGVSAAYELAADFEAEHAIAEKLQESLLMLEGDVEGVRFSHLYRSASKASRVGGDFYDVFRLPDGKVGVLVGDVSGKGLDAAVLTALVKYTARAFAQDTPEPGRVVAKTNEVLVRSARMVDFASIAVFVVDPSTGRVTFCQAGHPPAMIRRANGTVELLRDGSPVIGAFSEFEFDEYTAVLGRDDVLLLYTDGVTEVRGPDKTFFGEEGLATFIESHHASDVAELPGRLLAELTAFGGGSFSDDIAIVAFRIDS
jgi:PAS domain S-box-containing protein